MKRVLVAFALPLLTLQNSHAGGSYVGIARCELVQPAYEGSPLTPVSILLYADVNSPTRGWIALDGYHADGEIEHLAFDAKIRYANGRFEVAVKSAAEHRLSIRQGSRQPLEYSHHALPKKDQYLCNSK